MVLVVVGTLVVCGLGVAGWQMLKPSPETSASDEGSLGAMASNALEVAVEMGSVLRENVTRDASRLAELLVGPEEEEVEEDAEEVDAPADLNAVVPTPKRPRVARRAPTPEPAPAAAPPVTASIPELLPLPGMFDSGTPGIIPPGTENIRLHILDPEQLPTEEQGLVEVIVSPYGEVERAKLISAPGDIHEAMILSAIKAWQFTPARKDGHPVRYRLILPVDVALSGKVMTTRDAP